MKENTPKCLWRLDYSKRKSRKKALVAHTNCTSHLILNVTELHPLNTSKHLTSKEPDNAHGK